MRPKDHFWLGAIFGLVCGIVIAGYAKADDSQISPAQVQAVANKVVMILGRHGITIRAEIAPAYLRTLHGADGITIGGAMVVNSNRPEECREIILAHEFTHLALGRDLGKTPDESEPVARAIEHLITDEALVNCFTSSRPKDLGEALIVMKGNKP